ncbi:CHAT domain-containing protein [Streptosporangium roseum]|uniref:CHAT domain-containing protein n=1 Tax=Streptosporangium roseum TaxID=2001 RepID=UPI00332F7817
MSDIIVYLNPFQGGGSACYVKAPLEFVDSDLVTQVRFDEVYALHGPTVRQVGELLAAKIRENHAVDSVFDHVLHHPGGLSSQPIGFRVGDADAHGLSWEALRCGNDFIALDPRWPIVRIARGGNVQDGAQRSFAPPLHLACVLSAVGRPAINEWWKIYSAVRNARRSLQFPIRVTLFAGEEAEVIKLAKKAARKLGDPDVRVEPVPGNASELLKTLTDLTPPAQLLHFYCHGMIASTERMLEIGTINDFDNAGGEFGPSSVQLRVQELGQTAAKTGTWAVILNICHGAEAAGTALTHAEEIVNSGVPVSIGMRRQVDAEDAFAFSGAFYPEVFAAIRNAVLRPDVQMISWGDTLLQARRKLRDTHGNDPDLHDAWTLPVLYTRPGRFNVVLADPADPSRTIRSRSTTQEVEHLGDALPDEKTSRGVLDDLQAWLREEGFSEDDSS